MSTRLSASRLGVSVAAVVATTCFGVSLALADPVPSPGSPGHQYAPPLTRSTFSDPSSALRPKYRWWQPIADDNDATLRSEVDEMAAAGAGGYEQNGFGINMNPAGIAPSFRAWPTARTSMTSSDGARSPGRTAPPPRNRRPPETA